MRKRRQMSRLWGEKKLDRHHNFILITLDKIVIVTATQN
jgi:hypothetical protein